MRVTRRTMLLVLVVMAGLLAAACDGAYGDESPEASAEIVSAVHTSIGDVLVEPNGLTLYAFSSDQPGWSNCAGACATTWAPVPGDLRTHPGLVADFTVIERADGTTQLQAGEWPLYTYSGDGSPGDVNGHGLGDAWFAVTPEGTLTA